MALIDKIQAYIGTVTTPSNADAWLTDGARGLIMLIPESRADQYENGPTIADGGTDVSNYRILEVVRDGYECRELPAGLLTQIQDSNSLVFARPDSPVYIVHSGKMYIYPLGGTIREAHAIPFPTVLNTDSVIANFPPDYEQMVVLYAAIQGQIQKMKDLLLTLPSIPSQATTQDLSADFTLLDTHLDTEEDLELAEGVIAEIRGKVEKLASESQIEVNKYLNTVQAVIQRHAAMEAEKNSLVGQYNMAISLHFPQAQPQGPQS